MSPEETRLKALELARKDAECRSTTFEKMMERAAYYERFLTGSDTSANHIHGQFEPCCDVLLLRLNQAAGCDLRSSVVSVVFSQHPDQVFSGHSCLFTHNHAPSSDEPRPTDSQSTGREESVADDADPELDQENFPRFWGEMTGYQLSAIERGFIPDFIKKTIVQLATDEIQRRRGA